MIRVQYWLGPMFFARQRGAGRQKRGAVAGRVVMSGNVEGLARSRMRRSMLGLLWVAGCWLVLLGLTRELWLGEECESETSFPQIPLASWAIGWPGSVDAIALSGLVAGLIGTSVGCGWLMWSMRTADGDSSQRTRWLTVSLWVVLASALVLVIGSQQRWQPWVWQFFLVFCLALADKGRLLRNWQLLVISIYGYSAVSKWNGEFVTGPGAQLWQGLLTGVGLADGAKFWSPETHGLWIQSFPVGEMTVAVLLLVGITAGGWLGRWGGRLGLLGSVVMHGLLLVALGPKGLNHSWGVLGWNVFFIGQNLLIFGGSGLADEVVVDQPTTKKIELGPSRRFRLSPANWVLLVAVGWPAAYPWRYCDAWVAWSVYAPRPVKITATISAADRALLPQALQEFVEPADFQTERCRVAIDRWALEETGAPLPPQERLALGVSLALAKRYGLTSIEVLREMKATKKQLLHRDRLFGINGLEQYGKGYAVNSMPRRCNIDAR